MAIINRNIVDDYVAVVVFGTQVSVYEAYEARNIEHVLEMIKNREADLVMTDVVSKEEVVGIIQNEMIGGHCTIVEAEPYEMYDRIYISVMDVDN